MNSTPKIPHTRTIGFRLTESEYQKLVAAADQEQRRMADLVRLLVVRALKDYPNNPVQFEQPVEIKQ